MDPTCDSSYSLQECLAPKSCVKPDLKEGLVNRRTCLQKQIADLDAAINALEQNPTVAQVLELVGRASRY